MNKSWMLLFLCLILSTLFAAVFTGCSTEQGRSERSVASASQGAPVVSDPNTRPVKWR